MGYSLSPNEIQAQASKVLLSAASKELTDATLAINDFIDKGGDITSEEYKVLQENLLVAQEAYRNASRNSFNTVRDTVFSASYLSSSLGDALYRESSLKETLTNLNTQKDKIKEELASLDPTDPVYLEKQKRLESLESQISAEEKNMQILQAEIKANRYVDGLVAEINSIKNCDDLKDWVTDKFEPLFKDKATSILKTVEPVKPWLDSAVAIYELSSSLDPKNIGGIIQAVVGLATLAFQPLKPYYYMYMNAAKSLNELTSSMQIVLSALNSKKDELKCGFDIPIPSIPTLPDLPELPV